MIGGTDIVVGTPGARQSQALEAAARCVGRSWPDMVIEDAETGTVYPSTTTVPYGRVRELLLYRDRPAYESWERDGATAENADSMVQLVSEPHALTLVVDHPHGALMRPIVEAVRRELASAVFNIPAAA